MKEITNLNLIINYFSQKTNLDKENALYIFDLLFKCTCVTTNEEIEEILLKNYKSNSNVIKKASNTISFANNIKELLLLLNNSNSYALFENINTSNNLYYSVIWEAIHTNS